MRKWISQSFSTYLVYATNGFVLLCTVAKQQFTTLYKIDKLNSSNMYIRNAHTHTLQHNVVYNKTEKTHSQDEKNAQQYCTQTLSHTHTRTIVLFSFLSHQTMRCVFIWFSNFHHDSYICIIEKCWMKEPPRKWNTKNTTNSKDKYKLFRVYGAQTISKSKPMMTMWILYIRAPTLFWIS